MSIDLRQFQVTKLGASNVNVPRATISFVAVDSGTQAVLFDKTGANAISFPAVLSTFSAAEIDQFTEGAAMLVLQILRQRVGV
jgi:hypothetical protein